VVRLAGLTDEIVDAGRNFIELVNYLDYIIIKIWPVNFIQGYFRFICDYLILMKRVGSAIPKIHYSDIGYS